MSPRNSWTPAKASKSNRADSGRDKARGRAGGPTGFADRMLGIANPGLDLERPGTDQPHQLHAAEIDRLARLFGVKGVVPDPVAEATRSDHDADARVQGGGVEA